MVQVGQLYVCVEREKMRERDPISLGGVPQTLIV